MRAASLLGNYKFRACERTLVFKAFKNLLCSENHRVGNSCKTRNLYTVAVVCTSAHNLAKEGYIKAVLLNRNIIVFNTRK